MTILSFTNDLPHDPNVTYRKLLLMSSFTVAPSLLIKIFVIFRITTIFSFQNEASLITAAGSFSLLNILKELSSQIIQCYFFKNLIVALSSTKTNVLF